MIQAAMSGYPCILEMKHISPNLCSRSGSKIHRLQTLDAEPLAEFETQNIRFPIQEAEYPS